MSILELQLLATGGAYVKTLYRWNCHSKNIVRNWLKLLKTRANLERFEGWKFKHKKIYLCCFWKSAYKKVTWHIYTTCLSSRELSTSEVIFVINKKECFMEIMTYKNILRLRTLLVFNSIEYQKYVEYQNQKIKM